MGARIDAMVMPKTAKAAGPKPAAGKRAADLTDGMPADFGQELAKAQPRKKPAAPSEPVESSKSAPTTAKTAKKPQAKKEIQEQGGDDQQTPVDATKPPEKSADTEGEDAPISIEGELPLMELPEQTDEALAPDSEIPAEIDPAQFAIPAAQLQPAPVTGEDADVDPDAAIAAVDAQPLQRAIPAKESPTQTSEVPSADAEQLEPATATEVKTPVRAVAKGTSDHQRQDNSSPSDLEALDVPKQVDDGKKAAPVERFAELFDAVTDDQPAPEFANTLSERPTPDDLLPEPIIDAAQATQGPKEAKPTQQPAPTPETRFAEVNHPKVVTAVKTQLLPGGGSIQLRLDPPDLGPMRLEVTMNDGIMSASIVAATDKAAGLLTHSLGQLKHALEGAGISVDKLQVRQDASTDQFSSDPDQQKQGLQDQTSARQEQQRREMLNRMWRKISGGDPLDLVA